MSSPISGLPIVGANRARDFSFFKEDASERNTTHSATIAGKLINISIPAILWSFDTISE